MTVRLELRGFRLDSDGLSDERTIMEAYGVEGSSTTEQYRNLLRFLAVHIRKKGSSIPEPKYEKPNCEHLTEPEPSKFYCVHERNNSKPQCSQVHLVNCNKCYELKQKRAEQKTTLVSETKPEPNTHVSPFSLKPISGFAEKTNVKHQQPKISMTNRTVKMGSLEWDVVENFVPHVKVEDGSRMCTFSGDLVYVNTDCKQCKQVNNPMYSACVYAVFQLGEKSESNLTASKIQTVTPATTKNSDMV